MARRTTRARAVATALLPLVLAAVAGCGGGGSGGGAGGQTSTSSGTGPAATDDPTTAPGGGTGTGPTSQDPLPTVTSTVAGSAVAGNSGGVGPEQTDSFSEAVRNGDGTCSGWAGPGGTWTQGLEEGATVRVLDPQGRVVGTGSVGRPAFTDVDPSDDRQQWTCTFPFTATVTGPLPVPLRIRIAGLAPITARPDPTQSGRYVASVSTTASQKVISSCDDAPRDDAELWQPAVGLFWSNAFGQICGAGVGIVKVERSCRPPTTGSDHVVAVLAGSDPSRVVEDSGGLRISAVTELGSPATVVVRVANGQPC
ncbi:MAG: hypothetical protein ACKVZ6_13780 [Kineosporiaceae bacterium]